MPTLSEYFQTEARNYLQRMRELVAAGAQTDAAALQRTARALRGTAQLAREDRVYRAGLALESAARGIAAATLSWSDDLVASARAAVDDLNALVERNESESLLDSRLRANMERWQRVGVPLPGAALGETQPAAAAPASRQEFRAYAAKEVDGVADALEQGVRDLGLDPMDREPLKNILRRQRALLGAARLDEMPVVAEILRAIEDLTRVIAKLDVGVKQEWLDIYRVAREGLKAAVPSLERDEDPPPSHALARLRHMRAELLERYGAGETVNHAAGENEGLAPAQRMSEADAARARAAHAEAEAAAGAEPGAEAGAGAAAEAQTATPPASAPRPAAAGPQLFTRPAMSEPEPAPAPAAEGEAIPVTELEYQGEAALRRALELRQVLESALERNPDAREQLDELFDLIRLALK